MTTNLLGIQFVEEDGKTNNIAIISSKWLTPKKQQTFWPPYKKQYQYEQSLKKGETPTDKWTLYDIQKVLFVEKDNNYQKAKKQLQFCEENSDIPSDFDATLERLNRINTSRIKKPPNRYCDSESSSDNENNKEFTRLKKKSHKNNRLSRPPTISDDEFEEDNASTNLTVSNVPEISNVPEVIEKFPSTSNSTLSSISTMRMRIRPQKTQKQLLILLVEIKEQNTQILALLKTKELNKVPSILPADIPVKFPIDTLEHVKILETYLKEDENLNTLTLYLASLGGKNITTLTNRIMKFLYTDNLAKKFSFFGKRDNKEPFSEYLLKTAVINAVKICHSDATDRCVEDILKVWLKHAPQRSKVSLQNNRNHQ
ncbi:uncharacterized protein [Linepithema humile]|uniref:uncharacterized protein n=1 Tax=Linepithema humile TaxID=83485 RepID=UPI00351F1D58